jgi:rod shape-determining protein MreD
MKYFIYVLILFSACLLQQSLGDIISVQNIVPDLAVITLCYVCMREGRRTGAIYGFITGLLAFSLSGGLFNASPLVFTILGFVAGSTLGYRTYHHIYELILMFAVNFLGFYLLSHVVLFAGHELFWKKLAVEVMPSFLYTVIMLFFLVLCVPQSLWRGRQFSASNMFGKEM